MSIRDFLPSDYGAVKALHEASGDKYRLPALTYKGEDGIERRHPLFISAKVLVDDAGNIRLFQGGRLQVEMYLLMDGSKWAHPMTKMQAIQCIDHAVRYDAYMQGIDDAVCYIPPTKKRFVKRIVDFLKYNHLCKGWTPLERFTKETR
jgi:hypothetical protein